MNPSRGVAHACGRGWRWASVWATDEAHVAEVAARYGFSFPIGMDRHWSVLDAYSMSLPERRYTSVTFVIDKGSTIRFVHGGPEFHPQGPQSHARCREDYAAVLAALDEWSTA